MGSFQFEWWTVKVHEATGHVKWEIKAKNRDNAIKQIKKMAKDHDEFVQTVRPDFSTVVFGDTLKLDRVGYQRRF